MSEFISQYWSILMSSLILTALFSVMELVLPAQVQKPFGSRAFNLAYYPFLLAALLGLQFLVTPFYLWLLSLTGGGLLPRLMSQPSTLLGQSLFAIGFAFVWDVWQYWVHRWQHASRFLWQTHKLHHADRAVNVTTHARHHVSNYAVFLILYAPVLILFGSISVHAVAAFIMFRLWGFVNHANVRVRLGPATIAIAGPQWHRIHHSVKPEHHGRNFATFFPLIDVIFGTYYAPAPDEYPETGLSESASGTDLREVTIAPILVWWGQARCRSPRVVATDQE